MIKKGFFILKYKYFVILFILSFSLYSSENGDIIIADKLYEIYKNNLTLENIDQILEFNQNHHLAIVQKAIIYDKLNIDLFEIENLLLSSTCPTISSIYHLISVQYRLKKYEAVILSARQLDIKKLTDSNTLYFIADSYLRLSKSVDSNKVLQIALHQFPTDFRFLELSYIINSTKTLLSMILQQDQPMESIIRLYQRITNPKIVSILENSLIKLVNNAEIDELLQINFNHDILHLLKKLEVNSLTAIIFFDDDSDTYVDTMYELKDGDIVYKSIDLDRNNIPDLEYWKSNKIPTSVKFNNYKLFYGEYPYVDSITNNISNNSKIVYDLYRNYTKINLIDLIRNINLIDIEENIEDLKVIRKDLYDNSMIIESCNYRGNNSWIMHSEPNNSNTFDKVDIYTDNKLSESYIDLDSDGYFDIHHKYEDVMQTIRVHMENNFE